MPSQFISPGGTKIQVIAANNATWNPGALTGGTNLTATAGSIYIASIFVPGDMVVSGIRYLAGQTSTAGYWTGIIYDTGGNLVGNTAKTSTNATPTASTSASASLTTGPALLLGPATYFIGIQFSTTDKIVTAQAGADACSGLLATSQTGAFGTVPATITPPTAFSADKGPVASLY